MRNRTIAALSTSALVLGLTLTAGLSASASDSGNDLTGETMIGGAPAPLILTPAELAAGTVSLVPGQALIVIDGDNAWGGTGGSDNTQIASFDPAKTVDGVEFNAGFTIGDAGTTTAWITDANGNRTSFNVTVEA